MTVLSAFPLDAFFLVALIDNVVCVCFCFVAKAFDYLDAPPLRVTGADVPMPYAHNLETLALPQPLNVVRTVKKVLNMKD